MPWHAWNAGCDLERQGAPAQGNWSRRHSRHFQSQGGAWAGKERGNPAKEMVSCPRFWLNTSCSEDNCRVGFESSFMFGFVYIFFSK